MNLACIYSFSAPLLGLFGHIPPWQLRIDSTSQLTLLIQVLLNVINSLGIDKEDEKAFILFVAICCDIGHGDSPNSPIKVSNEISKSFSFSQTSMGSQITHNV